MYASSFFFFIDEREFFFFVDDVFDGGVEVDVNTEYVDFLRRFTNVMFVNIFDFIFEFDP